MPNIKAVIEYDGSDFFGFQIQPDKRTVQGVIEDKLSTLMKTPVKIVGAGRTDAKVHATGQTISFIADDRIPVVNICSAINAHLPPDVRFKHAERADSDFHARFSAISRTYVYFIVNSENFSVMLANYAWKVRRHLDIDRMQAAAKHLIGTHDFSSFGSTDYQSGSTVRCMKNITVTRKGCGIFIKYKANAFLRTMARTITGILVEIGSGKRKVSDIDVILKSCNKQAAGITAPPQGLYLTRVDY